MENEEIYCRAYGKVQMVMFRDFVCRNARALGLSGYVRNSEDGSVEVLAQGDRQGLEKLIERIHGGSLLARVEKADVEWRTPARTFDDFVITQ